MAKQKSDSVYRIVDVVGVSEESWEEAGRNAVETAASSLRDLRVAEVTKMDMKVENGKVTDTTRLERQGSLQALQPTTAVYQAASLGAQSRASRSLLSARTAGGNKQRTPVEVRCGFKPDLSGGEGGI